MDFKIRNHIEKEYESLVKEEKNYPCGTKLLDDEDRVKYLKELKIAEKNLLQLLRELPVSTEFRAHGIKFKKVILERKLKEVENSIKHLSRSKVFVSVK